MMRRDRARYVTGEEVREEPQSNKWQYVGTYRQIHTHSHGRSGEENSTHTVVNLERTTDESVEADQEMGTEVH